MTIPGLMQPTPLTLHGIFRRMREVYADGTVRGHDRRASYAETADRVLRLCAVLTDELGVRPGDRVATFCFNSTRHFELYWAVPLVGAVLHTVNVRLYSDQIAHVIEHAEDRVVFVDAELVESLEAIAPRLEGVERWVRLGEGPASGTLAPLDDYEELLARATPASALVEPDEHAAMGLCYTSGTTGDPKGVLTSHRGMWLHSMATCMADHIGLREHDVVLPVVPMFHVFGWGLPYSAPFTGAELAFHGSDSSPENLGRVIAEERVTVAAGVPTIWKSLLPLLQRGEVDGSSLRCVFVGGAASPRALIEAYEDLGIPYLQIWGMTETCPLACASRPRRRHRGCDREEQLDLQAKTGTIFAGLEARIVADDGTEAPRDGEAAGELEVRGPWIASDYYRHPGSSERFRDGWLRTGDMAVMEADGTLVIVDRAKDLVKSGGEWISSVELEGHLLAHPDVADAAVVGVRSRKWDERPVAVLVAAQGRAPTLDSVRSFLADRVVKWWLPDDVVLVDEIPKTSVGKIDKKVLRDQLADRELP